MKQIKEILICTSPFIVTAMMIYPFMAIVGASLDPFTWAREDRMFYFICTVTFGWGLLYRVSRDDL